MGYMGGETHSTTDSRPRKFGFYPFCEVHVVEILAGGHNGEMYDNFGNTLFLRTQFC